LVIAISEVARMRSFIYYGVGGALVALASYYGSDVSLQLENTTDVTPVANALQLAAAAGILGGLTYWLIAGRNAGLWRERRVPSVGPSFRRGTLLHHAIGFLFLGVSARRARMNRIGLLIALAIAVVAGLVFGLYPRLDLEVARYFHAFEDRNNNMFALRIYP